MRYKAQTGRVIPLGRVGENEITEVVFDCSCWIAEYGAGEIRLVHRRNCDSAALPIEIAVDGGVVTWTLTAADTAAQGEGEAQLTYYAESGKVKKSAIYKTMTTRSLTSGENTPQPYRGFVDTVITAAQDAEASAAAAQAAKTDAQAAAAEAEAISEAIMPYAMRRLTDTEIAAITSFADMPKGVYLSMRGDAITEKAAPFPFTLSASATYIVRSYSYGNNRHGGVIEILAGGKTHYRGYIGNTQSAITWYNESGRIDEIEANANSVLPMSGYNTENLLERMSIYSVNRTSAGCTYTGSAEAKTVTVTGTSTGNSFCNVAGSDSEMPSGVAPGSWVYIKASGFVSGVSLAVYLYPNTLPNRSLNITGDYALYVPAACTAIRMRLETTNGTTISGSAVIRLELLSGKTMREVADAIEEDGIKLLVFGNSFAFSTLNYLPLVLREIMPSKRIVLGILYSSGANITSHIAAWDADTAYSTYASFDTARGTFEYVTDTVTGKDALTFEKWDYVVLQNTLSDILNRPYERAEALADRIAGYVSYPFSFLYNMQQALPKTSSLDKFPDKYQNETLYPTGKARSDGMFADQAAYTQQLMADCIISDVLPTGTAVQNARSTGLSELGVMGDLAEDNTGHLQNGLPVLIGAYTAAYKLCELSGIKPKIYGNPYIPTDAGLAAMGYSSNHGVCVGVTDENRLLAQKCALAAIKAPYAITDMSGHEE